MHVYGRLSARPIHIGTRIILHVVIAQRIGQKVQRKQLHGDVETRKMVVVMIVHWKNRVRNVLMVYYRMIREQIVIVFMFGMQMAQLAKTPYRYMIQI